MDFLQKALYRQDVELACNNVLKFEQFFGKRILITGATGLVGSFLADMFRFANEMYDAKVELFLLSRDRARLEERFGEKSLLVNYVVGDICTSIDFSGAVDYVIHAAANSYPALFREDPSGTIVKSVEGTSNILKLATEHGAKRFLFVSSGEVYGQYSSLKHTETENGTVDILSARSCYPLGKQAAENLCICYAKQMQLPLVIARLCHTFGPNALASDNRAHMQFIRNAVEGNPIVLKSEGRPERSYMYIADSVAALLSILTSGENENAYNACCRESMTIHDFAKTCAEVAKVSLVMDIPPQMDSLEKSPIEQQILDGAKLETLGWNNKYSIADGIGRCIAILKEI